MSHAPDAPKGEEPESWHGFRRGERVRHKNGWCGKVLGGYSDQLEVETDHDALVLGRRNFGVYQGAHYNFTRLAPPQPLGDGDRLCDACGRSLGSRRGTVAPGSGCAIRFPETLGAHLCNRCMETPDREVDEMIRASRKQLAEKPAEIIEPTAKAKRVHNAFVESLGSTVHRYPHTGFVPYSDRVGLQSLSAPKPDDGPAYVNANWPEDSEYWGQG